MMLPMVSLPHIFLKFISFVFISPTVTLVSLPQSSQRVMLRTKNKEEKKSAKPINTLKKSDITGSAMYMLTLTSAKELGGAGDFSFLFFGAKHREVDGSKILESFKP